MLLGITRLKFAGTNFYFVDRLRFNSKLKLIPTHVWRKEKGTVTSVAISSSEETKLSWQIIEFVASQCLFPVLISNSNDTNA